MKKLFTLSFALIATVIMTAQNGKSIPSMKLKTLEGKNLAITVPKGTQPGTVLSISEQGLPTRGGGRGNIYLTIQADIPSVSKQEWVETLTKLRNEIN